MFGINKRTLGTGGGGVVAYIAPPINTAAPMIFGGSAVGSVLLATSGTWTGNPSGFNYLWRRDGAPIVGAASASYVRTTADIGHDLTVAVLASNGGGLSASAAVSAVAPATVAATTTPLTILGARLKLWVDPNDTPNLINVVSYAGPRLVGLNDKSGAGHNLGDARGGDGYADNLQAGPETNASGNQMVLMSDNRWGLRTATDAISLGSKFLMAWTIVNPNAGGSSGFPSLNFIATGESDAGVDGSGFQARLSFPGGAPGGYQNHFVGLFRLPYAPTTIGDGSQNHPISTAPQNCILVCDGANASFYVDGALIEQAAHTVNHGIGTINLGGSQIDSASSSAASYGDALVATGDFTSGEIAAINTYLNRWKTTLAPVAVAPAPTVLNMSTIMKPVSALGSMIGGSSTITFASDAAALGFAVNDPIIVSTGGEAGQGKQGTMGVGGGWPALNGTSLAANKASTPPAPNVGIYVSTPGSDYGKVIFANDAGTAYYDWDPGSVYTNKLLPRALLGKVTAVSGNTVTINKAATVATTNALVAVDNYALWKASAIGQMAGTYYGTAYTKVTIPAGHYYVSRELFITGHDHCDGMVVQGAGKGQTTIQSALGTSCAGFSIFQADNVDLSGFDYIGNFGGVNGNMSCFFFGDEDIVSPTAIQSSQRPLTPLAIGASNCTGVVIHDYTTKNILQGAGSFRYCTNSSIKPFGDTWDGVSYSHVQEYALPAYVQWWYQDANGYGNSFKYCRVDNTCAMGSFEPFQSENSTFTDCGGKNTLFSANSAGGWKYIRPSFLTTGNDAASYDSVGNNAIMQNNTNADNYQSGGGGFTGLACTMTLGNPGVVSFTGYSFSVGDAVRFTTDGALPTGLTAGALYYVVTVPTASSIQVSATTGGAPIAFTGSQSGAQKVILAYSRLVAKGGMWIDPKIIQDGPCNTVTGNARTAFNFGPSPNVRIAAVDPANPKGHIKIPTQPDNSHDAHLFMAARGGGPLQGMSGVLIEADTSVSGYASPITSDDPTAGDFEITNCGFDFALTAANINAHGNLSKAAYISAYGSPP